MIVVNARFLTQNITGVQRYGLEISLKLKEIFKDQIRFVTPHNIVQAEYAKELDAQVVGKHTGHVWEQYDLVKYLKAENSPLLLCLANTAPLFYSNKIATIHDVAFEVYPNSFSKSFLLFYKFFIPRVAKSSRHIITVSEFSKQEIAKYYGIPTDKISVVYNAVNEKFIRRYDEGLASENFFLAVSSLNYRKNFIAVLKAFDIYSKNKGNLSLKIIGDLKCDSFQDVNIDEYKNNPRIEFCGRVSDEDLIKYYSNAAGFLYPSIYEGFGIPPLEAQKCGCPALCSDIPPLREVMGESALYCDPFNIEDIAQKMFNLELLKGKMDVSLCEENQKRFSWKKSSEDFAVVINTLSHSLS